jgi:hypothetical protein
MFGGQAITEVGSTTYVVLVNKAATTGGINPIALNKDLLYGADDLGAAKTMGTITGLAKGYRVVVQASPVTPSVGTVAITASTGVVTLTNASFTTLALRPNDIMVVSYGDTTYATNRKTALSNITTTTAGIGDQLTATTGLAFKTISLRNIPN